MHYRRPGLLHEASFHSFINFVAQFMDGTLFQHPVYYICYDILWLNRKVFHVELEGDSVCLSEQFDMLI